MYDTLWQLKISKGFINMNNYTEMYVNIMYTIMRDACNDIIEKNTYLCCSFATLKVCCKCGHTYFFNQPVGISDIIATGVPLV